MTQYCVMKRCFEYNDDGYDYGEGGLPEQVLTDKVAAQESCNNLNFKTLKENGLYYYTLTNIMHVFNTRNCPWDVMDVLTTKLEAIDSRKLNSLDLKLYFSEAELLELAKVWRDAPYFIYELKD